MGIFFSAGNSAGIISSNVSAAWFQLLFRDRLRFRDTATSAAGLPGLDSGRSTTAKTCLALLILLPLLSPVSCVSRFLARELEASLLPRAQSCACIRGSGHSLHSDPYDRPRS